MSSKINFCNKPTRIVAYARVATKEQAYDTNKLLEAYLMEARFIISDRRCRFEIRYKNS